MATVVLIPPSAYIISGVTDPSTDIFLKSLSGSNSAYFLPVSSVTSLNTCSNEYIINPVINRSFNNLILNDEHLIDLINNSEFTEIYDSAFSGDITISQVSSLSLSLSSFKDNLKSHTTRLNNPILNISEMRDVLVQDFPLQTDVIVIKQKEWQETRLLDARGITHHLENPMSIPISEHTNLNYDSSALVENDFMTISNSSKSNSSWIRNQVGALISSKDRLVQFSSYQNDSSNLTLDTSLISAGTYTFDLSGFQTVTDSYIIRRIKGVYLNIACDSTNFVDCSVKGLIGSSSVTLFETQLSSDKNSSSISKQVFLPIIIDESLIRDLYETSGFVANYNQSFTIQLIGNVVVQLIGFLLEQNPNFSAKVQTNFVNGSLSGGAICYGYLDSSKVQYEAADNHIWSSFDKTLGNTWSVALPICGFTSAVTQTEVLYKGYSPRLESVGDFVIDWINEEVKGVMMSVSATANVSGYGGYIYSDGIDQNPISFKQLLYFNNLATSAYVPQILLNNVDSNNRSIIRLPIFNANIFTGIGYPISTIRNPKFNVYTVRHYENNFIRQHIDTYNIYEISGYFADVYRWDNYSAGYKFICNKNSSVSYGTTKLSTIANLTPATSYLFPYGTAKTAAGFEIDLTKGKNKVNLNFYHFSGPDDDVKAFSMANIYLTHKGDFKTKLILENFKANGARSYDPELYFNVDAIIDLKYFGNKLYVKGNFIRNRLYGGTFDLGGGFIQFGEILKSTDISYTLTNYSLCPVSTFNVTASSLNTHYKYNILECHSQFYGGVYATIDFFRPITKSVDNLYYSFIKIHVQSIHTDGVCTTLIKNLKIS